MKKQENKEVYLSPEIEMIKVQPQSVVCQSFDVDGIPDPDDFTGIEF